jgi:choline dehydrogenase
VPFSSSHPTASACAPVRVRGRRRFLRDSALVLGAALWPRATRAQIVSSDFDYIIVGAGSSGCVLANRLTADPLVRVLLVEAGGPPVDPAIAIPGRWTSLIGSAIDWKYSTEPEPAVDGRRIAWPRGKAYGGSSAIGAMAYMRGHRLSFAAWARAAGSAWSYRELLPYFIRSERNSRGASDYHGADGPWVVADTTDPHAGHLAFLEAARALGFAASPAWDFDGPQQEGGAGFYQKHILNGRRQSVADAFLTPALQRPNLVVLPNAHAARVTFTGSRATGVELIRAGKVEHARARREVVLAAGVIGSPKLLMLSGIGPAEALGAHGIPVIASSPEVGANLQDHPRVSVQWEGRQVLPGSSVSAGLLTYAGPRTAAAPPDIQFYVGRGIVDPDKFITLTVALTQPASRGRVTLRSSDPLAPPLVHAGYFTAERDLDALVEGVRLARALAETPAYAPLRGAPTAPGAGVRTTAEIKAYIRATSATMFHPAGTCRMGIDADAVVDGQLRVRGVEGLRVVDASVMPVVVNCQSNAACVMIGERAADLMERML